MLFQILSVTAAVLAAFLLNTSPASAATKEDVAKVVGIVLNKPLTKGETRRVRPHSDSRGQTTTFAFLLGEYDYMVSYNTSADNDRYVPTLIVWKTGNHKGSPDWLFLMDKGPDGTIDVGFDQSQEVSFIRDAGNLEIEGAEHESHRQKNYDDEIKRIMLAFQ